MRKQRLSIWVGVASVSLALAACATHHRHESVVVTPSGQIVTEAPPAPRQEAVGTAPGADYVWMKGYWIYRDMRWVWIPGHWEVRPRVGAAWVAGHWDRTANGWSWTPGHWENVNPS